MTRVGSLLRDRRQELKYSQSDLGERVGVDRSYIAQIESGRTKWPESIVHKLADALQLPIEELHSAHNADVRWTSLSGSPAVRFFDLLDPMISTHKEHESWPALMAEFGRLAKLLEDHGMYVDYELTESGYLAVGISGRPGFKMEPIGSRTGKPRLADQSDEVSDVL